MRILYTLALFLCTILLCEHALAAAGKGKGTKKSTQKVDINISDSDEEQGPSSASSGDLYNPGWDTDGGEVDDTPRPLRGRAARSRGRGRARAAGPSTRSSPPSTRSATASTSNSIQQQSHETRAQDSADPSAQDDPIDSRPPTPETPERVGRRYLALQADPPNHDLYLRPDAPLTLPRYPETDRQLHRTFHPHFIFNNGSRAIRYRELMEVIRLNLHHLEVETEADAILVFNRRELEAKDANILVTRGIAANSGFSNAALNWLDSFRHAISSPRHRDYMRLRQQCDDELAAHEADLQRRVEAAAALRAADEAVARMAEQPVYEQRARTPPQTRSRTASRALSPAGSSHSRLSRSRSQSQASRSRSKPSSSSIAGEVVPPRTPVRLQVPADVINLCTPSPPPPAQPLLPSCEPGEPATIAKGKGKIEVLPEAPRPPVAAPANPERDTSPPDPLHASTSGQAAPHRGDSVVSSSDAEEAAALEYERELARVCAESIETARQDEHTRRTQVDGERIASTSAITQNASAAGGSGAVMHASSGASRPASVASRRAQRRTVQLPEHITSELRELDIPEEQWPAFEQIWRAYEGREYPAQIIALSERLGLGLDEEDAVWLGAVLLRKN